MLSSSALFTADSLPFLIKIAGCFEVVLSMPTLGAMTLSIMTFRISTVTIKGLFVPLSINDTQHKNTLP